MLLALEWYPRSKARETTFADRLRQSKRDVIHGPMIGAGIDPIANFVYAEKHKCHSTLTGQNRADR
ncbi:MAG: hypothetical protein DMF26_19795 [Verrucomicrobia bacterium]|nr:MAG: hypothetical protein DMF26_19795 [Verrucomicrobiota bacterium]